MSPRGWARNLSVTFEIGHLSESATRPPCACEWRAWIQSSPETSDAGRIFLLVRVLLFKIHVRKCTNALHIRRHMQLHMSAAHVTIHIMQWRRWRKLWSVYFLLYWAADAFLTYLYIYICVQIENSLDAKCSHIDIWLDIRREAISIRVEDNGHGFPPDCLHSAGTHIVSTKINPCDHNGESLYSIAGCSTVNILSRTCDQFYPTRRVVRGQQCISHGEITTVAKPLQKKFSRTFQVNHKAEQILGPLYALRIYFTAFL